MVEATAGHRSPRSYQPITTRRGAREALTPSPRWYRPSKMEDNSLAWMIMVNGIVVDVRSMLRDIQEAAYEKGLIPYLPGSQQR